MPICALVFNFIHDVDHDSYVQVMTSITAACEEAASVMHYEEELSVQRG